MMKTKKLLKVKQHTHERSYEEIIDEIQNWAETGAKNYIPELCTALKRKNPLISSVQIRATIVRDVCPDPWKESTVRQYWPTWLKNPKQVAAAKDRNYAKQLQDLTVQQRQNTLDKEEEQRPLSSMPKYEYDETHPETEESPFQALGEINRAIARLWTALTGDKNMATKSDDIKKDFIVPSRERFKDIANGSSKIERDFLWNWLTWLEMVINDRLNILEKADKTAYDRD